MKRWVAIAVAILSGVVILVDFFVTWKPLAPVASALLEGATMLAAVALLMGAMNLVIVHGRRAIAAEPKGGYGAVLIVSLLVTFIAGVLLPGTAPLEWIFGYLYAPLQASMVALLAFFVVSAAYRAFRIRNAGAAVLLGTSLFVLFAQLAWSANLSPVIPALRDWMLMVPVTAAVRGILFGIALGIMGASLRILLGIDRPYLEE